MENPGMVFLYINLAKDLILILIWLKILPSERENLLLLTLIFLISSFAIYYKVIRQLNRS